jgi:hypothetical protein
LYYVSHLICGTLLWQSWQAVGVLSEDLSPCLTGELPDPWWDKSHCS